MLQYWWGLIVLNPNAANNGYCFREVKMITLSLPVVLAILGALALIVIAILVIWRIRSVRTITGTPLPPMPQRAEDLSQSAPQMTAPSLEEILPDSKKGFSSQLQTTSYNIRIEVLKDQAQFVVNGVTYNKLEDIPDAEMRKMAEKLLKKTVQGENVWQKQNETMRQVMTGNQSAIEIRNPSHTISVQHEGGQTRYVIDGLTYYHLKDIPDPDMSRKARKLEKQMA
jgi:hypothetical protein